MVNDLVATQIDDGLLIDFGKHVTVQLKFQETQEKILLILDILLILSYWNVGRGFERNRNT